MFRRLNPKQKKMSVFFRFFCFFAPYQLTGLSDKTRWVQVDDCSVWLNGADLVWVAFLISIGFYCICRVATG